MCQGDHRWHHEFARRDDALDFLRLLVRITENEDDQFNYDCFYFDIEDDCIWWESDHEVRSCPGWHWTTEHDLPPIMLDGKPLISYFSV